MQITQSETLHNAKYILKDIEQIAGVEDDSNMVFVNADAVKDGDLNMKDVLKIRRIIAGIED